jgi:CheY-like chemotaxis protein
VRSTNQSDIQHYYLSIINQLPNLVYLLDKNCTLTGCNQHFCDLLAIKNSAEAIGTPPYKLLVAKALWSSERVELFKKDDINALLSDEPLKDREEAPIIQPNGDIVYYLSSRIPLLNEAQEVVGLLGILTDVSQQKKMEEQLSKIKEQLQYYNAQKEPESAKKSTQFSDKHPPKVLMVEDNSIAQKAAQSLLMQLDCHVDVAACGDKAMALFTPGKYDLVFMDIGLEDTSGYIVSKRIRQLEKGTPFHVPIIALTGFEADVVKYDCDEYTMEGALTKPLTSEQAKQIIQHFIYHIDIPVQGLKTTKGSMS